MCIKKLKKFNYKIGKFLIEKITVRTESPIQINEKLTSSIMKFDIRTGIRGLVILVKITTNIFEFSTFSHEN